MLMTFSTMYEALPNSNADGVSPQRIFRTFSLAQSFSFPHALF